MPLFSVQRWGSVNRKERSLTSSRSNSISETKIYLLLRGTRNKPKYKPDEAWSGKADEFIRPSYTEHA